MSASTPRRADVSAHDSPAKSPSRRVLGDLTPKAINTPSKQTNIVGSTEAIRAHSPLKQVHTLSPMAIMGKENAFDERVQAKGKKRSIYEVEDAENIEHASKPSLGRDAPCTDRDALQMGETHGMLGINIDRGSSTEPDTPPPAAEPMEDVIDNSQASNQSFSTFVDWKKCDSQPSELLSAMAKEVEKKTDNVEQEKEKTVEKKATRAEMLRARLGMATYKVKTNQIEKSGSEIMTTWESASSSDSTHAAATSGATSSQPVPSIMLSPVRQPTVTHVTANLDPGRPIPKLVGGPQLLPTAFSSRMVHDYALPSSPPDDLPKCLSPDMVMSPTRPDYRTPVMRRIVEESYSDEEDEEDLSPEEKLQRQREKRFKMGDLTSSVVKGNAAKGLLELSGRR